MIILTTIAFQNVNRIEFAMKNANYNSSWIWINMYKCIYEDNTSICSETLGSRVIMKLFHIN